MHISVESIIDASRVVEPQSDGYDTDVTLASLREQGWQRRTVDSTRGLLDGKVVVDDIGQSRAGERRIVIAEPPNWPNLRRAEALLRTWQAAYRQFGTLIDTFYPIALPSPDPVMFPPHDVPPPRSGLGSASGSEEDEPGTMYATVFDPIGTAQAFVHELAHQKLRALGIYFEHAERWILNPPSATFPSPVRRDRPRPMTAVLHALYSWLYITDLDLHMARAHLAGELQGEPFSTFRYLLQRNLGRVMEGAQTVRRHMEVDESGESFRCGLDAWIDRLHDEGWSLLDATQPSERQANRHIKETTYTANATAEALPNTIAK